MYKEENNRYIALKVPGILYQALNNYLYLQLLNYKKLYSQRKEMTLKEEQR